MPEIEIDTNILIFMASIGLVANACKTTFLHVDPRRKSDQEQRVLQVGNANISESRAEKLLGMVLSNDLDWKQHVYGKEGLINKLTKRLFTISRLSNSISKNHLKHVAEGLWSSKLRYGLAIYGNVRMTNEETKTKIDNVLQLAQNNLLRLLTGTRKSDKRSIKSMLEELDVLSVNQTTVAARLTETWKALNDEASPLKDLFEKKKLKEDVPATRSVIREDLCTSGASKSFANQASRLWNVASQDVRSAKSLATVKRYARTFAKSLPV